MIVYLDNWGFVFLTYLVAKKIYRIHMRTGYIRNGIALVITFLTTALMQWGKNSDFVMVVTWMTVWSVLCILCDEKVVYTTLYTVPIFLVISVLIQLSKEMVSAICSSINIDISDLLCEFISIVVITIFVLIMGNKVRYGLKDVSIGHHVILIVISIIDSICMTFLGVFVSEDLNVDRKWVIDLAYAFTVLGVFVQLGLLIAMILSRDEHKEKEALNAKYLEEQISHYKYLENREQETRKFRHDMKNHMMVLRTLYDSGNTEEFEEYFGTISERITQYGNRISVGNDTADAIINQYAQEAEQSGIRIQVEGHFPMECHIAAVDICTIFSNLLSNAVRAEKEASGCQVNLRVRNMDNELLVEVWNDYVIPVKRNGTRFLSTKEDRASHGLGLQNVYECVGRNRGVIHITTDNQIFDVKLSLKNTEA